MFDLAKKLFQLAVLIVRDVRYNIRARRQQREIEAGLAKLRKASEIRERALQALQEAHRHLAENGQTPYRP